MDKQKTNPFKVPGDYFDTLPGRLNDRILRMETEKPPVRRKISLRVGLAVAAALAALALLTFPLVRMLTPESNMEDSYLEYALLEGAGLFVSDSELAAYMEESAYPMDDEDAYLSQAIEYLASADMEMDLIFE